MVGTPVHEPGWRLGEDSRTTLMPVRSVRTRKDTSVSVVPVTTVIAGEESALRGWPPRANSSPLGTPSRSGSAVGS